jgi:serine/threonine protein kinase
MSISLQVVGGQYRIIGLLGTGNFGETYLAEDLRAKNRKCVIKRLIFPSHDPVALHKAKELFDREAGVLFDLSNPRKNSQIPQFFAYFDDNQEFYLVEEWIDGHTLYEELQQNGNLSEDDCINLLVDVLEILVFIHNEGIIHRDIKPANLMRRNQDGKIVLIDFGAVKEVVATSTTNQTQPNQTKPYKPTIIYTEGYAPLEQRQGKPEKNSDIYALGMTVLEMFTGLELENIKDSNTGEIIWPSNLKVRPELVKILEKMVDDDSQNRYQSAEVVLSAIKKLKKTWILAPINNSSSIQTTNHTSKHSLSWLRLEIIVPILVAIVAGSSFLIANSWMKSFSKSSDPAVQNTESTSPPISSAPEDTEANNPPKPSAVTTTKETNQNQALDTNPPNEAQPESLQNAPDSLAPIRFKKAETKPSINTGADQEIQSTPEDESSASENQIRFKRAN